MGKHIDVVTYRRDESPFGEQLPVPGYIHRVPRPEAHGGVATLVVESVEMVGDEVRAVVVTWDGPLCPLPCGDELVGPFGWADDEPPAQAELFPADPVDDGRRSHPAGRTATLPRRAESPTGA